MSFEGNLSVNPAIKLHTIDRQMHTGRQLFVTLKPAGVNGCPDSSFDLALRSNADFHHSLWFPSPLLVSRY